MGRKRRKLVVSCWVGRDYVQVHRCLQRTVTRRTRMAQWENELDLEEGDTLVYLMEHDDNESWWLAEDVKGQVVYVPAAYLMIILDETIHEEEIITRKEDGWNQDWWGDGTGWRKKKDLFGGSDRWMQENLYDDLRGRLYS